MKIYIITQSESSDYCGIGGIWFKTEAYTEKPTAHKRLADLITSNGKYSGLIFSVEEVELNKLNN